MLSPSDDPKFLQRGKSVQPPAGVGLGPAEDPQRAQRTAQHVENLKRIDPEDSKKTAWAMDKMFPGTKAKPAKDGGIIGGGKSAGPEQAKQQYDDTRQTLEQAGWQNTSDMPGQSTYSKGSSNISLRTDGTGTAYKLHAPPQAKKRGLFGKLNWTVDSALPKGKTEHSGAKKGKGAWTTKKAAKKGSSKHRREAGKTTVKKDVAEGEEEENTAFPGAAPRFKKAASLVKALDWSATGRPCGDDEKYPEKCGPGEEGGGWFEDVERDLMGDPSPVEMVPEQISPEPEAGPGVVEPQAPPEWREEGVDDFWTRPRGGESQDRITETRKDLEGIVNGIPSKLLKHTPEQAARLLREGPYIDEGPRGRRGGYKQKKKLQQVRPEDEAAYEHYLGQDPDRGPVI